MIVIAQLFRSDVLYVHQVAFGDVWQFCQKKEQQDAARNNSTTLATEAFF